MGRTKKVCIEIDGISDKNYSESDPKIRKTYPTILVGYLSRKSWSNFCAEINRALATLRQTSYSVLFPLLFLPVIGCCIIGHHVEKTSKERKEMVLDQIYNICKETSNVGVHFHLREEEINEGKPSQESIVYVEIIIHN